jgi:hypothetical protein
MFAIEKECRGQNSRGERAVIPWIHGKTPACEGLALEIQESTFNLRVFWAKWGKKSGYP